MDDKKLIDRLSPLYSFILGAGASMGGYKLIGYLKEQCDEYKTHLVEEIAESVMEKYNEEAG